MVTFEQWERGHYVPDDFYEPIFKSYKISEGQQSSIIGKNIQYGKILMGFIGKKTGVMLEPEFEHVLE